MWFFYFSLEFLLIKSSTVESLLTNFFSWKPFPLSLISFISVKCYNGGATIEFRSSSSLGFYNIVHWAACSTGINKVDPLTPSHYPKKMKSKARKIRERKTFSLLLLLALKMGVSRYNRGRKLISIINGGEKGGKCCMQHAHSLITDWQTDVQLSSLFCVYTIIPDTVSPHCSCPSSGWPSADVNWGEVSPEL